jgi:predicted metal-dependent hydrolase
MEFSDLTIIRSARRSVSLEVGRNGVVTIRAPKRASEALLRSFFEEKRDWIEKQVAKQLERGLKSKRYYKEGEIFHYLGEGYPLRLRDKGKRFEMCDAFLVHRASEPAAKKLLEAWYKKRARQIFHERLDHHAAAMNLPYSRLRLSSARTRWGSCRGDGINLNWRLVMAPLGVIDSVVIHELAHIRHKNHGKHFWNLVHTHCSDYKMHDKWLKKNAHLVAWD